MFGMQNIEHWPTDNTSKMVGLKYEKARLLQRRAFLLDGCGCGKL